MPRNLSEGVRTSPPPPKATTPPRGLDPSGAELEEDHRARSPSPVILSPHRSAPTQGPLGVPPLFSKPLPSGEEGEAASLSREELRSKVPTPTRVSI